jgi:hypothetical protein
MAERAARVTTACTVDTRAGLPSARVLARTYRAHHPGHEFLVLVVDGTGSGAEDGCRVVGGDWLDLDRDEFHRMATWFSASELVEAVKPLLLHQLLEDADVAVYLGSQIRVFAPFAELTARAAEHDVVLAPRVLAPLPQDGLEPGRDATDSAFHDDFVAVGKGARPFLIAWADGHRYRRPRTLRPRSSTSSTASRRCTGTSSPATRGWPPGSGTCTSASWPKARTAP